MGDAMTSTPRPKSVTHEALEPLTGARFLRGAKEAAQTALDAADRIIAVLVRMDSDADYEDGRDDEPSLAAPENAAASQVVYMRGSDRDGEAETPETVLPEVLAGPQPVADILPWRGPGNVFAAAGSLNIDLIGHH